MSTVIDLSSSSSRQRSPTPVAVAVEDDVIICVEGTDRTMSASLLSLGSAFFGMFIASCDKSSGEPVRIDVDGSAEDWDRMTSVIEGTVSIDDSEDTQTPLPVVVSALFLGNAYGWTSVKATAMRALRQQICRKNFVNAPAVMTAIARGAEFKILELALKHDLQVLAPLACFIVAVNLSPSSIFAARDHERELAESIPHHVRVALLHGQNDLLRRCSRLPLPAETDDLDGCTHEEDCRRAIRRARYAIQAPTTQQSIWRDNTLPHRAALCDACRSRVNGILARAREQLLDALPTIFGLVVS